MTTPTPRSNREWRELAEQAQRDLAAAQEAHAEQLRAAHARELVYANSLAEMRERAQRAEALAESFRKDAERYSYIKDDRRGKFVEALALRDAENWDAAIDSAREALK